MVSNQKIVSFPICFTYFYNFRNNCLLNMEVVKGSGGHQAAMISTPMFCLVLGHIWDVSQQVVRDIFGDSNVTFTPTPHNAPAQKITSYKTNQLTQNFALWPAFACWRVMLLLILVPPSDSLYLSTEVLKTF